MDFLVLGFLIVLGMVFQALFWGALIAGVVKLLKAGGGPTGVSYPPAPPWSSLNRVGPYEPGPVESEVGFLAASEGIDLNR